MRQFKRGRKPNVRVIASSVTQPDWQVWAAALTALLAALLMIVSA